MAKSIRGEGGRMSQELKWVLHELERASIQVLGINM